MNTYVSKRAFVRLIIICISVFIIVELVMGEADTFITAILRFICELELIFTLYFGVTDRELFNPLLLFSLTPLSLLLYSESVSPRYLNSLTVNTWVLGVINMLAFVWVVRCRTKNVSSLLTYDKKQSGNVFHDEVSDELQRRNLILHGVVLIAISRIPDLCRMLFGTSFFLGSTINYLLYPGLCCAWKSRSKSFIGLSYLVCILSFATRFNKSIFLSVGLVTILSYTRFCAKDKREESKLYLWISLAALAMIFIAFPVKTFIQNGNALSWGGIAEAVYTYFKGGDDHYATTIVWNGPDVLKLPYMYLVSAWNNVQYVMETQSAHTYGLWVVKPLLSWLQLDGLFESAYTLTPYSSFNTFGYVTVLYKDFGIYGSILGSILLGWFVSSVYRKFCRSDSPFEIACYAMTAQATLEMFFSNHFFMLSYPFTIIVVCWIYKALFKSAREL